MPRVHFVKKARKDIDGSDIKKGESYYWWKFRYGGKHVSRTPPKASQLTQSDYLAQIYDIEDEIASLSASEDLKDTAEDLASRFRDLASECEDKLNNMPESLQQGSTGELLQERADACNSAADEFEAIDFEYDPDIDGGEQEFWEGKLEEIRSVSIEY